MHSAHEAVGVQCFSQSNYNGAPSRTLQATIPFRVRSNLSRPVALSLRLPISMTIVESPQADRRSAMCSFSSGSLCGWTTWYQLNADRWSFNLAFSI